MQFRIISIGALAVHELWQKQGAARTPHATTTLVESDGRKILVDPGLPAQVIAARLGERAGLAPEDITDVFITCFRPEHRWGLGAFAEAKWLIAEAEREHVGRSLVERFQQEEDESVREALKQDIALLKRCQAAPDNVVKHVDLFPLPGFTPGSCGLLLSFPRTTTLVAGPGVATLEHLEQGRVLRGAFDVEAAQESLLEAVEIADQIVPGFDNVLLNPGRRGM
jgi:glyoxylase-like metal-dependent hydrolase (beta-lactamase superfamily II)